MIPAAHGTFLMAAIRPVLQHQRLSNHLCSCRAKTSWHASLIQQTMHEQSDLTENSPLETAGSSLVSGKAYCEMFVFG